MPEAGSLWPIVVLVAPVTSEDVSDSEDEKAEIAAPISMGSPNNVPVPCSCNTETGSTLLHVDIRSVSRITSFCAGPFGAVSDELRPS